MRFIPTSVAPTARLLLALLASLILIPASARTTLAEDTTLRGFDANQPEIAAPYAVALAESGATVLFERGMRERVAPASLTKIMTAHVALQRGALDQRVTVTKSDMIGQASMGLREGETLRLETLLHGLLLPSGNDAALAIARAVGAQTGGGSDAEAVARFVGWMNEEAIRLGLADTRFVNPHGLDRPGHYSTAYDLARLTVAAMRNPAFTRVFGAPSYTADGYRLAHGHPLIGRYPGLLGGKTGLTRGCGYCLVTAAERDGQRVVVVVLRLTRDQATADTRALLDWSFGRLDDALQPACRVFAETGQTVCDPFRRAWEERGGLARFGYPISDERLERDPTSGAVTIVQWFERTRFERAPDSPSLLPDVQLGLLGRQITAGRTREPAFAAIANPGDGSWFQETGHTLRHGFRAYWEATGGLAVYGFPISEEFQEVNPADGKTYTVQYFERARFEYHPEHKGTPYEVELGLLGQQALARLAVSAADSGRGDLQPLTT